LTCDTANAGISIARAQYFPTISLTGLFGLASGDLGDRFQASANVWSLGAAAIGPIFTGGRISGQVRASEAVRRQALGAYLQTVQTAFREVNDSLVNVQNSRVVHCLRHGKRFLHPQRPQEVQHGRERWHEAEQGLVASRSTSPPSSPKGFRRRTDYH
jgi:hypothetical protein